MIKRALISVSDKIDILEFAQSLQALNIEILSTGGTYKYLQEHNIQVIEVASITGFPEILDGRVKTLHPKIYGGILANRNMISHQAQLEEHGITSIDLVCVNLYPFAEVINKPDADFAEAIENIDIGGPAMIRASAKNHQHVVIVTNNKDYPLIINQLKNTGQINSSTRLNLAREAFKYTSTYDSIINKYLSKESELNEPNNKNNQINSILPKFQFDEDLTITVKLAQILRYGENSHQEAAFYKDNLEIEGLLASFTQLQGKELSYNNLVDADTAWECARQFSTVSCVIVKHANPCGVALDNDAIASYKKALACDPVSSFGGIIAFNTRINGELAYLLNLQFTEVIIAPEFSVEALAILAKKPNVRVLKIKLINNKHNHLEYKRIGGGLLVQTPELKSIDKLTINQLPNVTEIKLNTGILDDLQLAWNVARFVKSNAIILVKDQTTIGIGAGQMSRIDSTKIALSKALEFGFNLDGAVCASDAFFPFPDNLELLAKNGVRAIIQPGGSIKDKEIFKIANELNVAMILTGYRAFKH